MFKVKGQRSRSQRKVMHGIVIKAKKGLAWLGRPLIAMHSQLPRFLVSSSALLPYHTALLRFLAFSIPCICTQMGWRCGAPHRLSIIVQLSNDLQRINAYHQNLSTSIAVLTQRYSMVFSADRFVHLSASQKGRLYPCSLTTYFLHVDHPQFTIETSSIIPSLFHSKLLPTAASKVTTCWPDRNVHTIITWAPAAERSRHCFNALFSSNRRSQRISPSVIHFRQLDFFGLHFCCKKTECGFNFNHCDVIGLQTYRIPWNNAKYRQLRRSRSFRIINLGNIGKHLCYLWILVTYLLSCIVSEKWRPIFAVKRWCLSLTHSLEVKP